jgi:Zn-dependent metalloprotease
MKKTRLVKCKIVFAITLLFAVCCFMTTNSWAARKVEITSANSKGFIQQFNQKGAAMGPVFGLSPDEGFQLLRKRTDFNGETHYRYQQTFKRIPVWGMQTIISKGPSDKVKKLHGNLVQGIADDIVGIPASLDPSGALKKMKELHKEKNIAAAWNFTSEKYGTYICFIDGKAYLCYVVSFFADTECGNPSQPVFFIDVKSGNVIYSFNGLMSAEGIGPGGNLKTGYYYYGTDYPGFDVTVDGSICTMDTPYVRTVDLNHDTTGGTTFSYTCYENTHKEINGAYCPLNDAQYFGRVVYDMYNDWYGFSPVPLPLTLKCHYGVDHENAYWSDEGMLFGDGADILYPTLSLDIVSHETCHGFIIYNSDLILDRQSGGINESFCDMAGEAAEFYKRGSNDFLVGYEIVKDPAGAIRYMYDPTLDGLGIDHVDDYNNNTEVHSGAGIFNKAFYLLSTTSGWNIRMAFDIFVKANLDYWTPKTTFQQGAEAALTAAFDYGYPCQDVVDAFAVVGIPLSCTGAPYGEIYVKDITQTIEKVGKNYRSRTAVTIWAANGVPVGDATVYITWSGVVSGSTSGVTGADGIVTFDSDRVKPTGPFTITVDNVTHPMLTYNPALNVETTDTASY